MNKKGKKKLKKQICSYCGSSRNLHNDHIIAQSKGGKTTTPACAACNLSKGSKAFMEWIKYLHKSEDGKNRYRITRIFEYHSSTHNQFTDKILDFKSRMYKSKK